MQKNNENSVSFRKARQFFLTTLSISIFNAKPISQIRQLICRASLKTLFNPDWHPFVKSSINTLTKCSLATIEVHYFQILFKVALKSWHLIFASQFLHQNHEGILGLIHCESPRISKIKGLDDFKPILILKFEGPCVQYLLKKGVFHE